MVSKDPLKGYIFIVVLVLSIAMAAALLLNYSIQTTINRNQGTNNRVFILDAGHGGEDGGAVSCTGIPESQLNLKITLRLNAILRMLGYDCVMLRSEDISLHTEGDTIAKRKISDLKHRTELVNQYTDPILVSIHQNTFPDSRYSGAHIFYNAHPESKCIAEHLQSVLIATINQGSRRVAQKSKGVYLMEHTNCSAVLVECGFLSNPTEEANLRDTSYQIKLAAVLACTLSDHLDHNEID